MGGGVPVSHIPLTILKNIPYPLNKYGKYPQNSEALRPPGVLGIWGEWLFIFRELGIPGNYLSGARENALSFADLGSPAKKQKKKIIIRKSLHFV